MDNFNEIHDDEIEIDLKELILVLWRKAWVIILATILCGGLAFGYTELCVTPQYESTSVIYILSSSTSMTSITDLQLSSELTADYTFLSTSRPVVEEVIENLSLDYTYDELVKMVSVTNPSDSHLIQITVTSPDNQEAMNIANEMADVVSDRVATVMATDTPTNAERAVAAEEPSSPSVVKNIAIGLLLGMVLACGVIVVIYVLDDTIKTEEDVVKYLGKSVLATLPREGKVRKETKDSATSYKKKKPSGDAKQQKATMDK